MRIFAEAVETPIRSEAAKLEAARAPEYAQAASVVAALGARFPMRTAVMFASASAGEGTTAAVLGVAAELSATYRSRVLVVEFNFSRPTFTSRFSLDEERTLTGSGDVLEAVSPVAPNVSVVAAGGGAPGSIGDMVARITRLLSESQGKYDVVLIDAPPLLERADALALAGVVSRMVLVVEAGRTSSKDLERVRSSVAQAGIDIVGAVLNKEKKIVPRWLRRWLG